MYYYTICTVFYISIMFIYNCIVIKFAMFIHLKSNIILSATLPNMRHSYQQFRQDQHDIKLCYICTEWAELDHRSNQPYKSNQINCDFSGKLCIESADDTCSGTRKVSHILDVFHRKCYHACAPYWAFMTSNDEQMRAGMEDRSNENEISLAYTTATNQSFLSRLPLMC